MINRFLFESIFSKLASDNNSINSPIAVSFFRSSNLNNNILREVWLKTAKTSQTYLTKNEFFLALRLIALAQNGYDIASLQSFENRSNFLPNFAHDAMPKKSRRSPSVDFEAIDYLFEISFEEEQEFQKMFELNKDKTASMSHSRLKETLEYSKVPQALVVKLLQLVPFKSEFSVDKKEFIATIKMLQGITANNLPFPNACPNAILVYLCKVNQKRVKKNFYSFDLGNSVSSKINDSINVPSEESESLKQIREQSDLLNKSLTESKIKNKQLKEQMDEIARKAAALKRNVTIAKESLEILETQTKITASEVRNAKEYRIRQQQEIVSLKIKINEREMNKVKKQKNNRVEIPRIMIESSMKHKKMDTNLSIPSINYMQDSFRMNTVSPLVENNQKEHFNFDLKNLKPINFDLDQADSSIADKMNYFPEF